MIVSGIASGASSIVSGRGMVTFTLRPAVTPSDGFAWRPFTDTRPSSIRRRAWLRDSSGQRRAINVSSRSPPRSAVSSSVLIGGSVWFRREHEVGDDNRRYRNRQRRIGDVERRIRREIDEIGGLAEANAVEEIAGGAAQHHPYRDRRDRVVERRVPVVEVDRGQPDAGHHDQEDRLVLQNPESGPRVGHVADAHRPVGVRPGLTLFKRCPDNRLRHLIEGEYGQRRAPEQERLEEGRTRLRRGLLSHFNWLHHVDVSTRLPHLTSCRDAPSTPSTNATLAPDREVSNPPSRAAKRGVSAAH